MKKLLIYLIFLLPALSFGQNIPRPNIPAAQGLSVNSFTGNLFYQRNEMSLRGTGYRIYQSFYYNAATDTLDYGYGHGWSFYYNIFYTQTANSIIIQHSDAKKDTFLLSGGSYISPTGVFETLTKAGSIVTLTSKDGKQQIFGNAAHKKITAMTDANGNYVVIDYTGNYPAKVRNSTGRCLLLNWQSEHLSSASDSANPSKKYTYTYDNKNDLTKITNPLNGEMRLEYQYHNIIRMADENSNPVVIGYLAGKVKKIVSCNTEQEFTFLDGQNKTFVSQKAQSGTITNGYFFDSQNRLSAVSDADNKQTTFTYDNKNNLTEWKDFKGLSTKYEYDSKGNVVKETDHRGNATVYTYEPVFNRMTSIKDKRGNTTTMSYDAKGNLTSVVKPGNITQSFTYDTYGKILTAKNANGHSTTYQYNSDGDLTEIQYPIGSVQYQYNGNCCGVGKITDANGNTQEMTYDLMGRSTSVKDKTGNTIQYEYDAAGNVVKEIDPRGIPKEYGYDALNRLSSVTLKVGTWHYEYDGLSNLVMITDANGHKTKYDYNNKSQLTKETDAIGNSTGYSYDLNGNLIMRSDPNGNVVNYKYDDLSRLIEKSYTGNSDKYGYDAEGNMVSAYNNNIAYTFEYDNLNRLLKKNIVTWGKSLTYVYDSAGNRKQMIDYEGASTNYNYDGNNRLISLKNPSNLTTSFDYDLGGRITKQMNGNGTYTTYHYDQPGRMDSLVNWKNSTTKISFFYYTFDQYGNRTSMTDKHGLSTYAYDSSYRLTKVLYADGSVETFNIDGTGNRTKRVKNGDTTSYTYNNADQIQTAGVSTYAFDANGNTIQQNDSLHRVYKYDGENRLLEVQLNPQKKVLYQYDPFGDKIVSQDTVFNLSKMIYDGNNLFGKLNSANVTLNKYTTAIGTDSWIGVKAGTDDFIYQKDGLNSITELTGTTGALQNEYSYDVYGNFLSKTEVVNNEIFYSGKFYENSNGNYYNRSRFYNPGLGRFINKDISSSAMEFEAPLETNKYAYAVNDPVNYTDQNGENPILIGALIAGLVAIDFELLKQDWELYTGERKEPCWADVGIEGGIGAITGAFSKLPKVVEATNVLFRKLRIIGPLSEVETRTGNFWKAFLSEATRTKIYNGINNSAFILKKNLDKIKAGAAAVIGEKTLDKLEEKGLKSLLGSPCEPDEPKDPKGPNEPPYGPPPPPSPPIPIECVTPNDPNELIGPAGYDTLKQWVSVNATMPYKILFENAANHATAPAQNVTIYLPISDKLNINSLRISDFGFGSFNFTVPPNTATYTNRLNVVDSLGVFVDVTAGLDIANHRAFWILQSIDPATGLATTIAPDKGFLLVNDSITHRGEGYVTFTLQPNAADKTGDSAKAAASIIFDTEDPIPTNTWVNIVDAVAPVSKLNNIPSLIDTLANITWSAKDDSLGVGIKNYELYYSKNRGPFVLYRSNLDSTSVTFTGDKGSVYSFYTLATDLTGNKESPKTKGDDTAIVNSNTLITDYFRSIQSGDWNNTLSWESSHDNLAWISSSLIPVSSSKGVLIQNGHTITVTDTTVTDKTIVSPKAALVVNSLLKVEGTNGLILQSDSTGTARIGISTGNITGNVMIEQFIPAKRAWRLITAPFSNTQTIRAAWQENGLNVPGLGTHITGGTTANGFDPSPNNASSIKWYNQSNNTFNPLTSTLLPLTNQPGYMLFVRGDRTVDLSKGADAPAINTILRATGALMMGTQPNVTIPATGFTLIGNPYAAPIDFTKIARANVPNRFYVWDPKRATVGAYVLFDSADSYMPMNMEGSYTSANAVLQSGQAFFVQGNDIAAGTLGIAENNKSLIQRNVFRTNDGNDEKLQVNLHFFNPDNTTTLADAAATKYNNAYSSSVTPEDAGKPDNIDENVAIVRDGRKLMVERRPLIDAADTIFLKIYNMKQKNYQFEFIPDHFSTSALSAYLEDTYLKTSTPVSLSAPSIVRFKISDTALAYQDRFRIIYKTNSTLPLNNTIVKAYQKDAAIQVDWNVSAETNIDHYEVEKSANGKDFALSANMMAAANNNTAVSYNWLDIHPIPGNNFYRIKTVDKTRNVKLSQVVIVRITNEKKSIVVYPNPVTDKVIMVQLNNQPKGEYLLQLFNSVGQQLFNRTIIHLGGSATQTIPLTSAISKGVYQLYITNGDDKITQQLIVQ